MRPQEKNASERNLPLQTSLSAPGRLLVDVSFIWKPDLMQAEAAGSTKLLRA